MQTLVEPEKPPLLPLAIHRHTQLHMQKHYFMIKSTSLPDICYNVLYRIRGGARDLVLREKNIQDFLIFFFHYLKTKIYIVDAIK